MEGGFSSNLRHQECVRQSLEQGAPDRSGECHAPARVGQPYESPLVPSGTQVGA